MSDRSNEHFGTRVGMMLAMLGMAVGTGNIWRFPRIAAKNGGGEFLVAWVAFLFLWSIPLILLEFGMGRKTRAGALRSFVAMIGPRWAWMGAFCIFVATAIMCYYSVVAGWTLRYTVASLTGEIPEASPGSFFAGFTTSTGPLVTHAVMIGLAVAVVSRGVRMIERVARILMPALIILVLILTVRAVFLPGAGDGLAYMFSVDWSNLANARIWIEALTQNAWDTGAGWGLVLCYAAYQREKEDTALNGFILPIANNAISLLAGIMIFSTVFSVVPDLIERSADDPSVLQGLGLLEERVAEGATFSPELMQETVFSENNSGITFTWMPQLFESMPFGRFFMFIFFLALAFAAFTSLVAMAELATRTLVDEGIPRARAIRIVGVVGFVIGIPSALWMQFLDNQDWVWGVALMLSGLFFAVAVAATGVRKFRSEHLNHPDSDIKIGRWWDFVIAFLVPIEAVFLLGWFLYQAWRDDPANWLAPFASYNVGTVLFQFAIVFSILIAANRWWLRRRTPGPRDLTRAAPSPSEAPTDNL